MNTIAYIMRILIILFIIGLMAFPFIFGMAFDKQITEQYESQNRLTLPEQSYQLPVGAYTSDNPFDQSTWSYITLANEVNCMALNIYFEARDQDTEGQIAVGLVTINRVLSKHYPNSVCGVVWQKNKSKKTGKYVAQFSWTLDGAHDTPTEMLSWEQSKRIAESLLDEGMLFNLADFTKGATHYHADYVDPFWNKTITHTIVVGDHLFYNSSVAKVRTSKL